MSNDDNNYNFIIIRWNWTDKICIIMLITILFINCAACNFYNYYLTRWQLKVKKIQYLIFIE